MNIKIFLLKSPPKKSLKESLSLANGISALPLLTGHRRSSSPEIAEITDAPSPGCFSRLWSYMPSLKTLVSGALTAGAVGLRVWNLSEETNTVANIAAGFFGKLFLDSFTVRENLPLANRIVSTTLGQIPLFLVTQITFNNGKEFWNGVCDGVVLVIYGANGAIYFVKLAIHRRVSVPAGRGGATVRKGTFQASFLGQNPTDILKFGGCVATGAGAFFVADPITRWILSHLSAFLGSSILGSRYARGVDGQIQKKQNAPICGSLTWPLVRDATCTVAFLAPPVMFSLLAKSTDAFIASQKGSNDFDFTSSSASDVLISFLYTGGVNGFFDGASATFTQIRFESTDISNLTELYPHEKIERPLFKLFEYGVPITFALSLAIFAIDEAIVEEEWIAKIPIPLMTACLFLTAGAAHKVSSSWDLDKVNRTGEVSQKERIQDALLYRFIIYEGALRPSYLFFCITNAMKMDRNALTSDSSLTHQAIIVGGYGLYGVAQGLEFYRTYMSRYGNDFNLPMLVFINGTLAASRMWHGKIP